MNALVVCEDENPDVCMYEFREKYRTAPYLAYLFKGELANNPVEGFRTFLKNLPPLISIDSFTFDKIKPEQFTNNLTNQYQGQVAFKVYGKGISPTEVQDMAKVLGAKCFKQEKILTAQESIRLIESIAEETTDSTRIDTIQANYLRELRDIMEDIGSKYEKLSNYHKIIRLFEMYRMLEEVNLCKT